MTTGKLLSRARRFEVGSNGIARVSNTRTQLDPLPPSCHQRCGSSITPVSELSRSPKRRAPLEGGRSCDMSSPIPSLGVNVGRPTMLLNLLWDHRTVAINQDAGVLAPQQDGQCTALPGRAFIATRWFGSRRSRRIWSPGSGQTPLNATHSHSMATTSRQSRTPGPSSFAVSRSFRWQGHHHR